MKNRPNFILFIADQLRFDYLGCNGHNIIKTPNIDKIASEGTNFSQFYVASQICMPNRASLMTGRYPSVHGLRYNGNYLPKDATTFIDVLSKEGYKTSSIGKIHLQPMTDLPPHPWVDDSDLGPIKEAWSHSHKDYTVEQAKNFTSDKYFNIPKPYYGFDHVDLVTGHGDKCNGHYIQWLRNNHSDYENFFDPQNQIPHNYSCRQGYRTPIPEEFYPTAFVEKKSIEYFNSISDSNNPFISFVSFPDPHHPFTPPGKYWDMYDPEDFEVNLDYKDHKNPILPMQRVRQMYLDGIEPKVSTSVFMAKKRQIQESMALTAGMITMIDDAIGNVIECLKKKNLYDNSVIIFTSDHGDYLGDFSLMLKGALPFRSITNVPFIWSDPLTRKAQSSNSLSSTIDIAPTILNRASAKPYWGIQGIDISESIYRNKSLREELMIEYHDNLARFGFERPAFVRSLITDEYRLTIYKNETFGELYDLKSDPFETTNLFEKSQYRNIRNELTERLVNQMMENIDKSPMPRRLA